MRIYYCDTFYSYKFLIIYQKWVYKKMGDIFLLEI